MSVARIIEFCCSFLLAVILISVISLMTLRPTLHEVRSEVKAEWNDFREHVTKRNTVLPAVVETVKVFESGHAKLVGKLLAERAVTMRSTDPDRIVKSVDEMDRCLGEIAKIVQRSPDLRAHPSFLPAWDEVVSLTHAINARRAIYNKSVTTYNRLLATFPQNLLTSLFGFVPLQPYPSGGNGMGY
jgi:LemA protein